MFRSPERLARCPSLRAGCFGCGGSGCAAAVSEGDGLFYQLVKAPSSR